MTGPDYDAAVAIIGMAGRFPGASSVAELWDNLLAGQPGLREAGDAELIAAGVSPAQLANPGYVRTTASLDGYDMFDAGMFGFNRREAELIEPQHRLFLECCWEALEYAGYPPPRMPGRVGVFAGCGYPDYVLNIAARMAAEPGGALMMAIGTERDSLASLVSYKLDLRGPSVTVQTFCSTSLVAVHLAAQSLLNFECEVALAGGVYVPLPQAAGYLYVDGGIYSPDGKVRAFDAAARGSVAGSGVSVVTLKRLSDALDDGDHIDAVILGSAVNSDGRACAGYTAPGVDGQAEVMAQAIGFAGVPAETIGYLECHGTGTMLGDSIELAALARVFKDVPDRPCVLGSLKPSIGHLDRASGSTGLIRAALALRYRMLPATPNFQTPNPALLAARDRFTVLTEHEPWPDSAHPRRAGVSAFGLGGTNAHMVLEEAPRPPAAAERPGPHLLVLSARDSAALDEATDNLRRHLDSHPGLPIADVAYTLQVSRSHFPVRRAVLCSDLLDACAALATPGRWLTAEARHRDPLAGLHLADPAPGRDDWWRQLRAAVHQVIDGGTADGPDGPPMEAAALALGRGLGRIGVRIGQVTGCDTTARLAERLAGKLAAGEGDCQWRLTLRPSGGEPAADWLLAAIARAWQAGAVLDWAPLHRGQPRRVPLPTYPFQRRRYWVDRPASPFFPGSAPPEGRLADLTQWTYAPSWRHRPVEVSGRLEEIRAAGPWLVLAAAGLGQELAEQLTRAGAEVAVVRMGAGFAMTGRGEFTARADSRDDMARVVGALDTVPRTVVHTFSLSAGEAAPPDPGAFPDPRARGFYSALALFSALTTHVPDQAVNLIAVTDGAVSVAGSAPRDPGQAALAGLVPVLAQENPGWLCRHVDVGPGEMARPGPAVAAAILAEAVTDHRGPVALRGTGRWVREYAARLLPRPSGPGAPFPAGGTVLITGGLGHVGQILAHHLALHRGCRLVLTSRSALPPREAWEEALAAAPPGSRMACSLQALLELDGQGAEVLTIAADVADEQQMRAAVDAAVSRFGGIDLVVHAAGVSDPAAFGPAHMLSRAMCESHFAAKVAGFHTLQRVLAGQGIPCITLSSLSAVLGGLALGPYSAANAALDAHAVAARAAGQGTWITVDWDTWRPDPPTRDPAQATEFVMAPEEAVEIFERALAAIDHVDHLVISTGPLNARFAQWVVDQGQPAGDDDADADDERDPRPDLLTPYVEPQTGTEQSLARIWARALRLDKVGADDDFFQLGGNSVLAIGLIARLRKELRVPVPTTALMGYPTIRGLAGQIDEAAGDRGGPVAAVPGDQVADAGTLA